MRQRIACLSFTLKYPARSPRLSMACTAIAHTTPWGGSPPALRSWRHAQLLGFREAQANLCKLWTTLWIGLLAAFHASAGVDCSTSSACRSAYCYRKAP